MMSAPIKPGDTLWLAPRSKHDGGGRLVTVTKIGRIWGYIKNGDRFDLATLRLDGFGNETLHRSSEVYEADVAIKTAWHRLRTMIGNQYSMPSNITVAAITQAAELLGFTMQGPPK